MEDRPGTLEKLCRALADRGVNIIAFEAFPEQTGKRAVKLVTDNPSTTKTVLDSARLTHMEKQVVQMKLQHRPGALANAAGKLYENKININYAYSGIEPGSNAPVMIFGVAEVGRAAKILDQIAAEAA